jgi:hypothetical protein
VEKDCQFVIEEARRAGFHEQRSDFGILLMIRDGRAKFTGGEAALR